MLELSSLTKLYGTVIGVNDITMSLPAGAYGLLGPNGSGKSTLLNLITGQLVPTIGQIKVLGAPPRNNGHLHRRVGYCPGSEGMYADVSARAWVRYLTELHGIPPARADAAATSALELVGMAEAMERPISTYSRGMRQRTKLAQALAHEPELLILDEPFNGLDPVGRHEMTEVLRGWIAQGKQLLLASHILHEVEAITNSFLLICGGRLLASGTAEEVHAMMVDVPTRVTIHCSAARRLGEAFCGQEETVSVQFDPTGQEVTISTRSAGRLYAQLCQAVNDESFHVSRVHSSDESLQSLFDSLMQIHRGQQ